MSVFFCALSAAPGPFRKCGFLLFRPADDVELVEGYLHAFPFLPAVGRACIFVGVLDFHCRISQHVLQHQILPYGPCRNADVILCQHVFEFRHSLEPYRAARVSHDHCIVSLLYAFEGNPEGLLRPVRHIVLGIVSRIVVLVRIDPEHGEVSGVARPHPVVGVGSELAD